MQTLDPDNDGDNDAVPSLDTDQDMGMGGGSMDMCVPLSSLKEPDENEQMTTPEVGNPVTMTVEGTISRVEGDNAYITPTAINGNEVKNAAPASEEGDLRNQAAAMGQY